MHLFFEGKLSNTETGYLVVKDLVTQRKHRLACAMTYIYKQTNKQTNKQQILLSTVCKLKLFLDKIDQ